MECIIINFLKLTDIELENEIKQSKEQIDSLFGSSDCLAYPMEQTMPTFNNVFHLILKYAFAVNQGERLYLPMLIN